MSIMSTYAEVLYEVLPRDTGPDICTGMQETFTNFTNDMVTNLLHFVRTHQDDDDPLNPGFNVIYVKRGNPADGETGRYYAINPNDPSFHLNDEQRDHFDNGIAMAIMSSDTTIRNAIKMLEAGQVHEVRQVYREAYADLQYRLEGFVRDMRRAKRIIEEKRANGST
jgi:hypothetical protein